MFNTRHFRAHSLKSVATAACLTAILSAPAFAQSAPERIANQWMDSLKQFGATTAEIGSMSYDASSGRLALNDVRVEWPIEFSIAGAGSLKLKFTGVSQQILYDNLREVQEGYRFDRVSAADGSSITVSADIGMPAKMSIAFDGYEGRNVFQPRLPMISADPDRPISRFFPLIRVGPLQEFDSFQVKEMRLTQDLPEMPPMTTYYRDIQASNMQGGIIENWSIGETTQSQKLPIQGQGDVAIELRLGRQQVTNFDYGLLVSMFDPDNYITGSPKSDSKTLLESASFEGLEVTSPGMFKVTLDSVKMENWAPARPKNSLLAFFDELAKGIEPSPDRVAPILFDILALYQIDLIEYNGLKATGPQGISGKLDLIRLANISRDGMGLFTIKGLSVDGPGGIGGKLDNFEIGNVVFPTAAAIIKLIKADAMGREPNVREILDVVPMIGSIATIGLDIRAPGGMGGSLEKSSLSMSDFIAPIPTNIDFELSNLSIPVSLVDDREVRDMLVKLGFQRITISERFEIKWDEESGDLSLDGVELVLKDGITIELSAVIGGVPRLVFENPEAAQAALATLTFKEVEAVITDHSITERAMRVQAEESGITADQFRQQMIGSIPAILAFLGNPEFTERVQPELTKFLNKPGVLKITAKPDNPVPATQLMGVAATAPQTIPDLLNLTVEAE